MTKQKSLEIIPSERIIGKIYYIRGMKVMFDRDLAELYGVEVRSLNQAVKRNKKRFPDDFVFQLDKREFELLKYHFGTSKNENLKSQTVISSWGGARSLPYVFTEQGVAMLSGVLSSKRAIEVNVQIIRTFVKLREMIISNKELRIKIEDMERKYDKRFKVVFDTLRNFLENNKKEVAIENREKIGFKYKK